MSNTKVRILKRTLVTWEQGFRRFVSAQFEMGPHGDLDEADCQEGDYFPESGFTDYEIIKAQRGHTDKATVLNVTAFKELTV